MEHSSPLSNSKVTCLFCRNVIVKKDTPNEVAWDWEIIWLQKCSESLEQLLDVQGFDSSFFVTGLYCAECTLLIREVDFSVRSVASMQSRLSKLRAQIAEFLIATFDNCNKIDDDLGEEYNEETLIDPSIEYTQEPGSPILLSDQDLSLRDVNIKEEILEETLQNKNNLTRVKNKKAEEICARSSSRLKRRISYLEQESDEDDISQRSHGHNCESITEHESELDDYDFIPSDDDESLLSNKRPKFVYPGKTAETRCTKISNESIIQKRLLEPTSTLPLGLSAQVQISIACNPVLPKLSETAFVGKMKSIFWKTTDEDFENILKSFVRSSSKGRNAHPIDAESESLLVHLLRTEIEEYHQQVKMYICKHAGCLERFTTFKKLRSHTISYHGQQVDSRPFQCFECDSRFLSDRALNAHIHGDHEDDPYAHHCDVESCGKKYCKDTALIRHIKGCHKNITIPYMGGLSICHAYRDKVAMSNHKISKRSKTPRSHYCAVDGCYYRAATEELVTFHHLQVHDKLPRPFLCKVCGKDYETMKSYRSHSCTNTKRHQCEYCGKTFPEVNKLTCHVRKSHKAELHFKCSLCHRGYSQSEDVKRHEKLHTSITGFNCVLGGCAEIFESVEDLRTHVAGALHDITQKTCVCELCGYVSKGARALHLMILHMRTHTGDSPMKCRFCDKGFKTFNGRKSHEEINHPDLVEKRIYSCKECDATFTVAQYLFKHNAWHKYGSNACRPVAKKR